MTTRRSETGRNEPADPSRIIAAHADTREPEKSLDTRERGGKVRSPKLHVSEALRSLLHRWTTDAATLRGYGDSRGADMLERLTNEARAAIESAGDELLTLEQAARVANMHPDSLRHLVASGRIPNAGRRGAPRIKRADVPRRPAKAEGSAYDPGADAIAILSRQKGA